MNNDTPSRADNQSWWKLLIAAVSKTPQDKQTLLDILRESEARNILDSEVLSMIEGAIQVSELQVRDVMVPRVQMVVIEHDAAPASIINTVIESGHSRFPVVSDDQHDVLGILLAKDLLAYYVNAEQQAFKIKDMMRPAVFIPESKRLNVLLRDFRTNRNHMAIVIDEYGIAGLVTIEDVMEEIVGEIEDEHDTEEESHIEQHGRSRYTVKAITPIGDFNKYFHTELADDDYDTIGGLITNAFGHLPKRGEVIDFAGFHIKVLKADKRKLQLLKFQKPVRS